LLVNIILDCVVNIEVRITPSYNPRLIRVNFSCASSERLFIKCIGSLRRR